METRKNGPYGGPSFGDARYDKKVIPPTTSCNSDRAIFPPRSRERPDASITRLDSRDGTRKIRYQEKTSYLPGLSSPAALIGVAEKGSVTLALTATEAPGHSSMPGPRSAIGALAAALARLEQSPLPAAIRGVPKEMLETLAPEMSAAKRVLLSNLWLFGPLVQAGLERAPSTNAMLRTTTALTVVRAGNKENVLPGEAVALVNFRLLPGDSIERVVGHARRAIHDERIRIEVAPGATEASAVAATDTASYQLINRTVRTLFPGVLVAPGLMIGGTDSRHMAAIADNVYRFSPVRTRSEDLPRFHGTDERISIENYAELIRYYHRLMSAAAGGA